MELEGEMMAMESPEWAANETVAGIVSGIVKENWNEEAPGKVLVELGFGAEGAADTEWIPVMQPYCGNGYGQYFLPEIGAQVVVGFRGGDINSPIVLGCLWNQEDLPPEHAPREDNALKLIRTKSGNRIELDETEGKMRIGIYTAGGVSIQLEDETQTIVMQKADGATGCRLDLKHGEAALYAEKKLTLAVGGTEMLRLEANGQQVTLTSDAIQIEGKQSLQLKSRNLKLEGNQTEVRAQGSVKIKANQTVELRAPMAKIN